MIPRRRPRVAFFSAVLCGSASSRSLFVEPATIKVGGAADPAVDVLPPPCNDTASSVSIRVRGAYNSGSNLFKQDLTLYDMPVDMKTNAQWVDGRGCNHWKHMTLDMVRTHCGIAPNDTGRALLDDDDTWFVIARHPLSWFLSMKQQPYDLRCGNNLIDGPCEMSKKNRREFSIDAVFANVFDYYNRFYLGYVALARARRNVVVVRYEDIVALLENTMEALAAAVPCSLTVHGAKPFMQVANAHRHRDCLNDGDCDYVEKIIQRTLDETWRDEFAPGEIERLCPLIDADLLRTLNYTC